MLIYRLNNKDKNSMAERLQAEGYEDTPYNDKY